MRPYTRLLFILGTASCATLGRQAFAPPEAVVTDVRLAGFGLQGGKLEVVLRLYNPNPFRLDASDVHYRVRVDSIHLGSGTIDRRLTVREKDSVTVRMPVDFGFREVLRTTAALAQRGTLDFVLEGDLKVLTPFGGVTRAFEQHGSFDGVNVSLMPPQARRK